MKEIRAYIFLARKLYPDRYFPQLLAFDHEISVRREKAQFREQLYGILLKHYPYSLETYLKTNPSPDIKNKIAKKLK